MINRYYRSLGGEDNQAVIIRWGFHSEFVGSVRGS